MVRERERGSKRDWVVYLAEDNKECVTYSSLGRCYYFVLKSSYSLSECLFCERGMQTLTSFERFFCPSIMSFPLFLFLFSFSPSLLLMNFPESKYLCNCWARRQTLGSGSRLLMWSRWGAAEEHGLMPYESQMFLSGEQRGTMSLEGAGNIWENCVHLVLLAMLELFKTKRNSTKVFGFSVATE